MVAAVERGKYAVVDAGPRGVDPDEPLVALFDQVPVAVVGYEGPDLRLTVANSAGRAVLGDREPVVGLPIREAIPEFAGQQVFELVERVAATGRVETAREWRLLIDRDGDGRPEEHYYSFTVSPWRWTDGTPRGVLTYGTDVTEQVRARRAVQARAADAEQRSATAHEVAARLQRAMLPAGLPVLPAVQLAATYLLADAGTAAGGDWFDAVPLPGGRVALVVGDVVGHGTGPVATMGQLRVLLHDRLAETGDIATALAALDRAADQVRGARSATVCVVVVDPGSGELVYCTAGHPPPLVVPGSGEPRYLAPTATGPLGSGAGPETATDRLGPGDLVVLYTDGILERPGKDAAASTVEMAQVAADVAAGVDPFRAADAAVDGVCERTVELLTRATGHVDDVTLLAAQLVDPLPPYRTSLPAASGALAGMRASLTDWLSGARVTGAEGAALVHVANELATNSIEHGYRGAGAAPDAVVVDAELEPCGTVRLRVVDRGRWRAAAPDDDRGHGLAVSIELVDRLHVERGDGGTTVTVEHRVTRPALLLTAEDVPDHPAAPRPGPDPFLIIDQSRAERPRVRVDGPVDAATAPRLELELRRATAGGTRPCTVDLTGVSHLASAGVSVLHRVTALAAANGADLALLAPPGTPADTIMTLVRLPHLTREPDPGPDRDG
jgi:anti-anti-sigma factor